MSTITKRDLVVQISNETGLTQQQVFDVFTDVAGFRQRRGIADGEGDVQNSGQRSGQQRLAGAGGADEQHVGLVEFNFAVLVLEMSEPLVVVVDGHGQRSFGIGLSNDVLIEKFVDLTGGWNAREQRAAAAHAAFLLPEDVLAEIGAVGADVDVAWPFDHWADFA